MLPGEKTGVNVDLPRDDGAILDEVPLPDWGVGATNEVTGPVFFFVDGNILPFMSMYILR